MLKNLEVQVSTKIKFIETIQKLKSVLSNFNLKSQSLSFSGNPSRNDSVRVLRNVAKGKANYPGGTRSGLAIGISRGFDWAGGGASMTIGGAIELSCVWVGLGGFRVVKGT